MCICYRLHMSAARDVPKAYRTVGPTRREKRAVWRKRQTKHPRTVALEHGNRRGVLYIIQDDPRVVGTRCQEMPARLGRDRDDARIRAAHMGVRVARQVGQRSKGSLVGCIGQNR